MAGQNISHEGHRQRMRARVEQYGLESLAPHEALEYLLYITNARRDTNGIAHALLERFGSFAGENRKVHYISQVKSYPSSILSSGFSAKIYSFLPGNQSFFFVQGTVLSHCPDKYEIPVSSQYVSHL